MTGTLTDPEISAVLRSWEERFGAVLVEVSAGTLTLAVARPPATAEQALLRLAAEHWAFAPQEDGGRPDAIREVAAMLLRGRPYTPELRLGPQLWLLG